MPRHAALRATAMEESVPSGGREEGGNDGDELNEKLRHIYDEVEI